MSSFDVGDIVFAPILLHVVVGGVNSVKRVMKLGIYEGEMVVGDHQHQQHHCISPFEKLLTWSGTNPGRSSAVHANTSAHIHAQGSYGSPAEQKAVIKKATPEIINLMASLKNLNIDDRDPSDLSAVEQVDSAPFVRGLCTVQQGDPVAHGEGGGLRKRKKSKRKKKKSTRR